MTQVSRQLEAARQKLLDLTMRNRLLNFRPTKARTNKGHRRNSNRGLRYPGLERRGYRIST